MDHEGFLQFHKECCDKMHVIARAKNHDYSGKTGHAFENFTVVERAGITSAEQGFLVRMMDKFMRVSNFTKTGVLAVEDEKIEDSLLDLANYSILLAGYIRFKKTQSALPKPQRKVAAAVGSSVSAVLTSTDVG